jgi:hypothetical protein
MSRSSSRTDSPIIYATEIVQPSPRPGSFPRDAQRLMGPAVPGTGTTPGVPPEDRTTLTTPSQPMPQTPMTDIDSSEPTSGELMRDPISQFSDADTDTDQLEYATPTPTRRPTPIEICLPEAPSIPPPPHFSDAQDGANSGFEQDMYNSANWSTTNQLRTASTLEDIKRALRLLTPHISELDALFNENGFFPLMFYKFTGILEESTRKAEASAAVIIGKTDQILNSLTGGDSRPDPMIIDGKDDPVKSLTSRLDSIESSISEIKRALLQRRPDQQGQAVQNPPNMPQRTAPPRAPPPPIIADPTPPPPQKKPVDTMSILEIQQELMSGSASKNRKRNLSNQVSRLMTMAPKEIAEFAARNPEDPGTQPELTLNPISSTAQPSHPEQSWAQVAKNGAHSGSPLVPKVTPPPPTNHYHRDQQTAPQRRRRLDDSQMWIIRFINGAPPNDDRLTDQKMWSLANSINKEHFPFEAKSISWSRGGSGPSIMIRFSSFDKVENIDAQSREIRLRLAHGNPLESITMTKNVKCSKIAIDNIPCRSEDDMDQVTPVEAVATELRKNPLYNRLVLVQQPRWVTQDLEDKEFGTVNFTFEDPEGLLADELCARYMFIFGKQCVARAWLDRVDIHQCNRCWRFGPSHSSCIEICRFCGKTDHPEEIHCLSCRGCVSEGNTNRLTCAHLNCPGCKQPHAADDPTCTARGVYVNRVRNQNRFRVNAQVYPTAYNRGILKRAVDGPLR